MSDQNNLESNVDLEELPEGARAYLRRIEKEVEELRPLKAQNDLLKLEKELRADGMDLSEKQLKALLASHEGEQTPAELRKTAEELKFVEPKPDTEKADVDAHNAIDAARNGASTDGAGRPTYEQEVEAAKSMEELQAIAARYGRPALSSQSDT